MSGVKVLDNVISVVESNTKKPENFLSVQNGVAQKFKKSLKLLYDFTKQQCERKTDALPELVTEDFDEEQIWQQLELQNEGEWTPFLHQVSKLLAGPKLELPISLEKLDSKNVSDEVRSLEVDTIAPVSTSEDEEDTKSSTNERRRNVKRRKLKSSVVDDKFFKLQDLDEYLVTEDKKEMQTNKKNNDDSDQESVDLFNDFSEDDEEGENEDARLLKYTDFFDSPENENDQTIDEPMDISLKEDKAGDSNDSDGEELGDDIESDDDLLNDGVRQSKKRVKFNLTNDSDDTDTLEGTATTKDAKGSETKSSLEIRQEKLQKRIRELEDEALTEKSWQLRGEVDSVSRPQNSLLQEYVEFDITSRPPPVITEQTTLKLEDIIRQRIKDKAWDDVEKKFKPVETPAQYKKKLVMDQEKSKQSLAQIYEDEYVKQKQALDPENKDKEEEEPKEHVEIRQLMHSLFMKLDALSNFHYTPKPAKPDIKIVSNIPAINMEEVAPVATSDATLLAPEEIKSKPRGALIGKAERTKTDMKRDRRHKKLKQRKHAKAKETQDNAKDLAKAGRGKHNKEKAAALVTKLSKERNISKMNETGQKVTKSSTAFFNQLQDQVKSHIKSKANAGPKKKDKNVMSAVKLKL